MSNYLYTCDNLYLLHGMNSASVDLIYLDPPFNSKRVYAAPLKSRAAGTSFKDMWTWKDVDVAYLERLYTKHPALVDFVRAIQRIHSGAMAAYVTYMTQRIFEMHRVLKPTGSLYLHIDPTSSPYLRLVMDAIFGKENFRNEIVWGYKSGGASRRRFSRKHDTILFYTKDETYLFNPQKEKSANRQSKKYGFSGVTEYKEDFCSVCRATLPETLGWYTMVHMKDVWQIDMVGRTSKERTGYPTQKPLALLERIIQASSREGDIVFDPFCGCATACDAAQRLQRRWIGCDIEEKALGILMERLGDDHGLFKDFIHATRPPRRTDVETIETIKITETTGPRANPLRERLYREQDGICNGCFVKMDQDRLDIDHIIPQTRGGEAYYENFQLLCGPCNQAKRDKIMDYLLAKVAKLREDIEDMPAF